MTVAVDSEQGRRSEPNTSEPNTSEPNTSEPNTSAAETACRTMAGAVVVVSASAPGEGPGPHAVTSLYVDPQEQVFDGHYPGFPILPGVCLIECVHRGALAAAAQLGTPTGLRLRVVESARFLDPVFPGETVTVELTWKPVDGGWQVRAAVRTDRADSARIRLRYESVPS